MSSMLNDQLPASSCPARPASGLTWLLCFVASAAILMLPALWNRFPLVFFDTSGYVTRVLEMKLLPGRSIFYGLFLWLTSLGWWSFMGAALVQSLFTVWLIYLMLRCHDLVAPLTTVVTCVLLGVTTGISWYTSQLMPDGLVPLVVIAMWLLGFRWQQLGGVERTGIFAIALLGIMSHMSCLALAIGLIIVVIAARVVVRLLRSSLSVNVLPPLSVVAAGLVLMPLLHLALVGKAVYTPGGPVYIFGRLVQEGIPQRWLAEHCPVPGIKLCGLQDRIPYNGDEFLWGEKSAFREIGEWTGAADAELSFLNSACLKAYPAEIAWTALRATFQQLAMVKTGDQLYDIHNETRYVFTHLLPRHVSESFNGAKQQQGQMTKLLFDALNKVHVPVAWLALFGLVLIAGWGYRKGRHDLAGLAVFVLLALLGNAFICGALSNPHDRYQSRIAWLAPLVVGMAAVSWWRLRRGSCR
ncbi:MAG: hypothetical protein ACD_75C00992G0002 [uncultured bacterium]|nr:MAG: hypothetical protein ACD_75C00992G0002 [uncultured bacterium]